jgi:GNAT superfamily N-acetyltransferase
VEPTSPCTLEVQPCPIGEPIFRREDLTFELLWQLMPLFQAHYAEVRTPGIELDPDFDRYMMLQMAGTYRAFTVRQDGRLIGYAGYVIDRLLHSKTRLVATEDVLFIDAAHRKGGIGRRLMEFADAVLRSEGVTMEFQHVPAGGSHGPLLERMGYAQLYTTYGRRL